MRNLPPLIHPVNKVNIKKGKKKKKRVPPTSLEIINRFTDNKYKLIGFLQFIQPNEI